MMKNIFSRTYNRIYSIVNVERVCIFVMACFCGVMFMTARAVTSISGAVLDQHEILRVQTETIQRLEEQLKEQTETIRKLEQQISGSKYSS